VADLRQYLDDHGMSVTDFADWLGTTRQTVSAWLNGRKTPSDKHKALIARRTRGEVPPESWFADAPGNGKRR
jgi:transcriptional regulator with XRE-family HTH domain